MLATLQEDWQHSCCSLFHLGLSLLSELADCILFHCFHQEMLLPSSILNEMRLHEITILSLLTFALSDPLHHSGMISANDIIPIFNVITKAFASRSDSWALAQSQQIYQGELHYLTSASFSLHANATHLVVNQISSFSIPLLCKKLVEEVPRLWRLMMSLLDMNTIDNSQETLPDELPWLQCARLTPVVRGNDIGFKTTAQSLRLSGMFMPKCPWGCQTVIKQMR